ncbi:Pre-rRNA-processing protein TSR2 -like protein [Halotydeus destructor]|nr:Pre-rRNA-processing protein TSR2 -like protein [Halotydeus destructor]
MASVEVFLSAVRLSLSEWPALQLAIEQGMGGDQAREKESWMAEVICDYFNDNRGTIDHGDLEEYIEEIVDNEFETVVHDGSLTRLVHVLCYYRSLCKDEKVAELETIINRKKLDLEQRNQTRKLETVRLEAEMESMLVDDGNDQGPVSNKQATSDSSLPEHKEDDGWTTVSKRKPNKH